MTTKTSKHTPGPLICWHCANNWHRMCEDIEHCECPKNHQRDHTFESSGNNQVCRICGLESVLARYHEQEAQQ